MAHLEKATAQESREKIRRITMMALGSGPEL
jgi:hypothetical protein